MIRSCALVVGTAALLSACAPLPNLSAPSKLQDDEPVAITGRVIGADGSAHANAKLSLTKLMFLDITELAQTLEGKGPFMTASTDASGAYAIALKGKDTKNVYGQPQQLILSASKPDGQAVGVGFQANEAKVALPTLKFWNGLSAPAAGAEQAGEMTLSWTPPDETPKRYEVSVMKQATPPALGTDVIWRQVVSEPSLTLPPYLFQEATAYGWQVEAVFDSTWAVSELRAFTSAKDATARLIPITAIQDGNGRSYPKLHDGVLTSDPATGAQIENSQEIVIDLGAVQPIGRVVGYGVFHPMSQVQVQASKARGDWGAAIATIAADAPAGERPEDWFDVDLKGTEAQYVRVSLTGPNGQSGGGLFSAGEFRVVAPAAPN